jgi:sugar phosphate isomerase/epimerase
MFRGRGSSRHYLLIILLLPILSHAGDLFDSENLVAWCIVPFDAKKRGPEARAEMLTRVGIRQVAYDWRREHVPSFEAEILAYKKHGLEYFAFWGYHDAMAALIRKHGIRPQLWMMLPDNAPGRPEPERVAAAARALQARVEQARELGCKVGLYNHGGWAGEPSTLTAVSQWFRDAGFDNVGIVYNLHHGHEHIADFAKVLALMKPHLLCLNLNGMNEGAKPKILPLGKGQHDARLLQIIEDSGYTGPIGILDHDASVDSELRLRENLQGLRRLAGSAY